MGKRQAPTKKWGKYANKTRHELWGWQAWGLLGGGGYTPTIKLGHMASQCNLHMHEWQEDTKSGQIYAAGRGQGQGLGQEQDHGGGRLPTGGVQVCPARPSAHDFTVFRPLLINFRPSGICKVTKKRKTHAGYAHWQK